MRRKTRKKLKAKKKPTVNQFLQEFETGKMVHIDICPSSKSIPHPRFKGRTGKIIGRRGRAYIVEVKDIAAKKTIIVRSEHLKPQR